MCMVLKGTSFFTETDADSSPLRPHLTPVMAQCDQLDMEMAYLSPFRMIVIPMHSVFPKSDLEFS